MPTQSEKFDVDFGWILKKDSIIDPPDWAQKVFGGMIAIFMIALAVSVAIAFYVIVPPLGQFYRQANSPSRKAIHFRGVDEQGRPETNPVRIRIARGG